MEKFYQAIPYTLPRYFGSDERELHQDLDEKDQAILLERYTNRQALRVPLTGDFIEMLDGTLRRFAYNWGDSLQPTLAWPELLAKGQKFFDGSFYLFSEGGADYSGGLAPSIPVAQMELIEGKINFGRFWFFHHNQSGAHRGVYFLIPCKTYRQLKPIK